ncbi:MAG: DedA family protein [Ignavibacteriaceae bacterium]
MLEHILDFISGLSPFWIYVSLFAFAFIENVFPPSPSDLVVVIGGSLIGTHSLHFVPTLLVTTIGSVIGFMALFFIGTQLDKKLIRAGKVKFIPTEGLEKVEKWFSKYGYWIILANRFLPGTRSVISLFAGLSELNVKKTIILATISAFVWNTSIIYLGILFGHNIGVVDHYLSTYSNIAVVVTCAVILFLILNYFWKKKKSAKG